MTGLEIALFILGAAFIIISFFIVDNSSRYTRNQGASDSTVTGEAIRRIGADAIEDMNRRSDLLIAESEDKLEALSNDKIIAVGEYSDQVLEKINSNHKEVVFLYQMLNDKEDELKDTVTKLENVRIECEKLIKAEAAMEAQRANEAVKARTADSTVKNIPPQAPQKAPAATPTTTTMPAETAKVRQNTTTEEKAKTATTGPKPGVRKTVASAPKNTVKKTTQQPASAPIEAEGRDNQSLSRNEEIIALHRQGKSVMEISKLLGMGQGEVRLIINLYG
ncbi:MAG: hypothetical protein K6G45_06785 [Lachnospiraceae bacterium]|nr:hypothetical protein [Lachnospiraceae bacterium]